jgi:hypothetical protein
MVPGVSYIYEIGGDSGKIVTMGYAHIFLESLQTCPEHAIIHKLVDELQLLIWGNRGPTSKTPAVYKLPEFKCNDRSL